MKKISAALLAVPLATSMSLTGCSGDTEPSVSSSSTATSPTTTVATPTPTKTAASPTAGPKTDPNIPAAARAHTPAGAEALVRYFHDQLNVAWGVPQAGLLAPLSLPSCKTCSTLEDTAANMVEKNERVRGDTVRIDAVAAAATESNGDQTVVITGAQLKTSVFANGKKVRDIPADRLRLLATARWTSSGWRIREIKVLK